MRLLTCHAACDHAHITCDADDVLLLSDAAEAALKLANVDNREWDRQRFRKLRDALFTIGRAMEHNTGGQWVNIYLRQREQDGAWTYDVTRPPGT